MNWRATTVNIDSHVFSTDIQQVEALINWSITDRSRGTITIGLDNCQMCVRNDRQIVVVRVRDDLDSVQNEHEILEVLNELTGKKIRKLG